MAYPQTKHIAWNELGKLYAHARFQLAYQAYIDQHGETIQPLEPSRFPVLSDTLIALGQKGLGSHDLGSNPHDFNGMFFAGADLGWLLFGSHDLGSNPHDFNGMVHSLSLASIDDRSKWISQFQDVQWAYLGSNFFTPLDTTSTSILRAHLQAYFGSPTQTAVETIQGDPTFGDGSGQFEYWIAVNDSIPVIVMDILGPFDRGIILATDHRFRANMLPLRQSLLRNAIRHTKPAAYVDYYYNQISEQWYRTGYDGKIYFTHQVDRPDFRLGRPVLTTSQE